MTECRNCGLEIPDGASQDAACPRCSAPIETRPEVGVDEKTLRFAYLPKPEQVTRIGRYEVVEELGRGGMGVVYRALDPQLKRAVAVKLMLEDAAGGGPLAATGETLQRFLREARAAARLDHPGIVRVLDVGSDGRRLYICMEFVEGGSLDRLLRARQQGPPLPMRRVLEIMRDVAAALAHAHARGILHRDVKPANVFVTKEGAVKLGDFGLARDLTGGESSFRTASGALLGTPQYMSPEQVEGATAKVGPASDVWAVGVMLYQALTGRLPFDAASLSAIFERIQRDDPAPPRRLDGLIPRDAELLCLKCLEKPIGLRYASAADLAADLARLLEGKEVEAQTPPFRRRAARWVGRNRAASVLLVLLGAGLIAGVEVLRARRAQGDAERRSEVDRAALEKSRQVSAVLSRWGRLAQTVERLERRQFSHPKDAEAVRKSSEADWPAIDAFAGETPPDSASQATMLALKGWAAWLAERSEEAIPAMREASRVDPDVPFGALLEALARSVLYWKESQLPRMHIGAEGLRFGPPVPVDDELRREGDEIVALLARARGARVWGRESAAEFQALVEGLQAFQAGEYATAEERLSRAVGSPDLRLFQRWVLVERAIARYMTMDLDGGLADLQEVAQAWPEFGHLHDWVGRLEHGAGIRMSVQGKDPRGRLEAAVRAFDRAYELMPGNVGTVARRAGALLDLGQAQERLGVDPRPAFRMAIRDLNAAIEREPGEPWHLHSRGNAWWGLARYEQTRGEEPTADGLSAMSDFGAAIDGFGSAGWKEAEAASLTARGSVRRLMAGALMRQAKDPIALYTEAIDDCERALVLAPGDAEALAGRGAARAGLADWARIRGEDPRDLFASALADYDAAIRSRVDPSSLLRRALLRLQRARFVARERSAEARDEARLAIEDLDELMRRFPGNIHGLITRGEAWMDVGRLDEAERRDPREAYGRAEADLEAAVAADAGRATTWNLLGGTRVLLGQAEAVRGVDPRPRLRVSIEAFSEAARLAPGLAAHPLDRGCARNWLAEAEAARGVDPTALFEASLQDFDEALEIDAKLGRAWACKAMVFEYLGDCAKSVECSEAAGRLGSPVSQGDLARRTALRDAPERPAWGTTLWLGYVAAGRGDYGAAASLVEAAIGAAGPDDQVPEAFREDLGAGHLLLARAHALRSAGRCSPLAEPVEAPPEEAARHRDRAFDHLERALSLGGVRRETLGGLADLAPLHADPRWGSVLKGPR